MNSKKENRQNQQIQSFVRVRPLSSQEKEQRSHNVIDIPTNREVNVRQHSISKKFTFDRVFGPKSTQLELYSVVVSPLIQEVLAGYNCTVFAYGQTGTGKTYTMAGGSEKTTTNGSWQNDPDAGIIPRTLSQLFDELRLLQVEHTVRVSYLELYNEELFDLLSPIEDSSKIRLYEDNVKKGSVIVHGLEEVIVHNKNEVYKILQKGSEKRQTASTLMNAQSSRSHTVFSITVHTKESTNEGEDLLKTGKLNLVDLAGSENIGRSGAVDKRAREAGNINQSLLTLGRVITALVERAPHVPYRESKLTRLLQDSLGGRTKTSIIATVSPATCNLEETLSTLEYAHRAKNITNRPEINQKFTKSALLKEYTEEIERLRRDLTASRSCNGIYLAPDNYNHMVNEIENYARELTEKINEHRAISDELEKANDICTQLKLELTETKVNLLETEKKLKEVTAISEEEAHLVEKYSETEAKLGDQARTLLNVVETVTKDENKLHDKLERVKMIESKNITERERFQNVFNSNLCEMQQKIQTFFQTQNNFIETHVSQNVEHINSNKFEMIAIKQILNDLFSLGTKLQNDLRETLNGNIEMDERCSDELKKIVQDKFTHSFSIVNELLNTKILPLLETSIAKSDKNVEQIRDNQQQLILKFIESHQNFDKLCLNIEQSMKSTFEKFSELYGKNIHSTAVMNEIIQKQKHELDEMMQKINSMKEFNENLEKQTANVHETSENMIRLYENGCDDVKNIGKQAIFDSNERLKLNEMHIVRVSDDLVLKECGLHDNCKELQEHLTAEIDELRKVFDSNIQTAHTKIIDKSKRNIEKHELMKNLTIKIDENLSNLKTNSNNLQITFENYHEQVKLSCDSNMSNLKEENVNFEQKICSDVNDRRIEVERFLTEDIIFDGTKPTGNTPIRKDFIPYPRYLAATAPRQVILERFRRRRLADNLQSSDALVNGIAESNSNISAEEDLNCLGSVETVGLVKASSTNDLCNTREERCKADFATPNPPSSHRLSNKENANVSLLKSKSATQLQRVSDNNPGSRAVTNRREVLGPLVN
ncbi:kinesin-like protein Klp61F [Chrysoperla carnea]|uniref:kinesin-like protein Klp61F n=1 Tax=Chrysoperla carnea TaxID=189513 RepID=UPI001D05DF6C|nr:kinesin-like protein Klp61F [Chrysoperla carnea]